MPPVDLTTTTAATLARMLRRLPPSLWDTDPASPTLQRDLYNAIASQCAIWLENREIARQATLLREAAGVDLDTLLADYSLKRYLQRPDAYARQIAMQILWTPKGTAFSIARLADLLFDQPHVTLRTGRGHVHVLLADTHAITTPYSYWGMLSEDGLWYALSVDGEVPTISQIAPPGLDVTPGGRPLHWFTVQDELSATWYITIVADTLVSSPTPPTWGTGTTAPVTLPDGTGTTWTLSADSHTQALVTTQAATNQPPLTVLSPNHTFQALHLVDSDNVDWWFYIDADTLALTTTFPAGATDVTPAGGPFRWLRLTDLAGTFWYGSPTTLGTWFVDTAPPGGLGTALPHDLGDAQGVQWHWGIDPASTFATSDRPNIDYGGFATAICLNDAAGLRWFWRVRAGKLEWSRVLWPNTIDQSPWGEIGWLAMPTTTGIPVYVYPALQGFPIATDGPPMTSYGGWRDPLTLVDNTGQFWTLQVAPAVGAAPEYWRVTDEDDVAQALWIDAEVPNVTLTPPIGGVDQLPADPAWPWLTVLDEGAGLWYITVRDDTLITTDLSPTVAVSPILQLVQDGLNRFWSVQVERQTASLRTLLAGPWRVGVVQDEGADIPLPAAPLNLREAMEAFGHVQSAGTVVTVLIT